MKQCFAVKERHPVLPDRVVHLTDSAAQAEAICQIKNGDSILVTGKQFTHPFYVGTTRMN